MLRGYVRVSTQEQAAEGRSSLGEQERCIRGFAMMKGVGGFDLAIYADPGISGSSALESRPQGEKLLADAKKGDTIVASKLDRMFRSAIDALKVAEQMKKRGINLVLLDMGDQPVTSNGMAECFFTMAAAFAQLERVRINERTADGRKGKKEKGGHIGGKAPYGWRVVGSGREAKLEMDEAEQQVIAVAKSLWANNSPAQTTKHLAALGHRDRAGSQFRIVQVKRLVAKEQVQ